MGPTQPNIEWMPRLNVHPFFLGCPDVLSLVGEPLSGNGCGFTESHIILVIFFLLTVLFIHFILDIKNKGMLYQVKQLNHFLVK